MLDIARSVQKARTARGWTQSDLAYQSGLSRPSIARIEAGKDISTATLVKAATALGLKVKVAK